jgi:secondary thiamine-phosphate synthase enzyme
MRFVPTVTVDAVTTQPQCLLDVTEGVADVVATAGLRGGICSIFCPHTSCGLAITEAEDGLHHDLAEVLERVAPRGSYWAHDDLSRRRANLVPGDRPNGHSHVRALLATTAQLTIPIMDGRLALGPWQRLFLVELDGGRPRRLLVSSWGD